MSKAAFNDFKETYIQFAVIYGDLEIRHAKLKEVIDEAYSDIAAECYAYLKAKEAK